MTDEDFHAKRPCYDFGTMILTPSSSAAERLQSAYGSEVLVRPYWSIMGYRADKIIVLPIPSHWTGAQRESAEEAIANALCRLNPNGELIRL